MLPRISSQAFTRSLHLFKAFRRDYWYLSTWQSVFFSSVSLINAGFEILALTMIWPMISLVLNPATAPHSLYGRFLSHYTTIDPQHSVVVAMVALCGVYVCKNLFILCVNIFQAQAFARWKERLSTLVYDKLLHAPYGFHSKHSSSELAHLVIGSVPYILNQFVDQLFSLVSNIILCSTIVLFIVCVVSPFVIIGVGAGVAILVLQHFALRKSSRRLGQAYHEVSTANLSILNQTFQAFKEVQMFQVYKRFSADFRHNMHRLTQTEKWSRFHEKLPSLANEVILVCIMMACMLIISRHQNAEANAFQQMGMLVVAFFRLIPTLNQISNSLVMLNNASVPLNAFLQTMRQLENVSVTPGEFSADASLDGPFGRLDITHVTHAFEAHSPVLSDLSFSVAQGNFLAVTGASGSGKSTLLNILMGFITPDQGQIIAGGQNVHAHLAAWQKRIAIVMQDFYILNSSLAENVAFGAEKHEIDTPKVMHALQQVGLDELCAQKTDGIWMAVGENGKLLSGGQRQRVALARALYFDKDVWILDEVTSALDIKTEYKILDVLKKLQPRITIIMSAHRLSVLPYTDDIIMLKQGRILAQGRFDDLMAHNAAFREAYTKDLDDAAEPAIS